MKNIGKFAVLGAVLAASASFAHASTLDATSWGQLGFNQPGVNTSLNGEMQFVGSITYGGNYGAMIAAEPTINLSSPFASTVAIPAGVAYQLNPDSVWGQPPTGSAWVGATATSGPVGDVDLPYGYYEFQTTLTSAIAAGSSLNVLADDTVEIYAGTTLIQGFGALGGDTHCGALPPSCVAADPVPFSTSGPVTLTFIVQQAGLTGQNPNQDPTGFAFDITTPQTPEPSSLMLLGTGLISAAGMMFRRRATV